ncbi:MAG: hypothetical protein ACNA7V_14185, partial [Bacteroidales bacterium]
MKKFTRLFQLMTLLLLMSSVAYAQVIISPQQKADNGKIDVKAYQKDAAEGKIILEKEYLSPVNENLIQDRERKMQQMQQSLSPQNALSPSVSVQPAGQTPVMKTKDAQPPVSDIEPGVAPVKTVTEPIDFSVFQKYGGGAPDAILYDNGPFVTHPGGGAGGADASALQTNLGMGTYGSNVNHAIMPGEYYYFAEDFMVTGTWTLNWIKFYGYQTGSTTTSSFTGVYVQIWNGDPSLAGSSIVWGDLTTNRILSTGWTNCYRTLDTDIGTAANRPIMEVVANMAGCVLAPGTYWVQWGLTGSLTSGPWGQPVTILGQTTTGNAKQKTTAGSAGWVDLIDVGPQGIPFVIDGTSVSYTNDVGVTAISSPVSGSVGIQNVTITVMNFGTASQSNIPVSYTFDGNTYNGVVPGPLAQYGSESYTFTQTINPAVGSYTIQACANLPGDEAPGNDCMSKNIDIIPLYDCDWTVELYDTYGDGWNGGTLSVIVDGVTLLNNVTLASGAGPAIYAFGVNDGSAIQTLFTAGSWAEECYYEIYDSYGIFVASSGPQTGGPPNLSLTGNCIPPACPAPTGLTTTNIINTGARAGWVKGGTETLWNLEYGPIGFAQGTGTLLTGLTNPNPFGNPFYDITGLTPGGVYEWYVQADCGSGSTSFWTKSAPFQTTAPVPANDECVNAELVTGPYPVTINATTHGSTIDCPGVLEWHAVWYEITLPYATNTFTVDYCGTLNQGTIGIVYYNDCLDCAAYNLATSYQFVTCPGGETAGQMTFFGVPGPGTILFPAYTATPQGSTQDFTVTFDVQEVIPQPGCQFTSQYPGGSVSVSNAGLLTTISTCNYAGEFSHLTNIQSGETYEFTMSDLGTGAYVTVADGPGVTGNVLAYGPSPLSYTTASAADLYVHWSLDEFCGTDFSCHVTTAQCTTCGTVPPPPNDLCVDAIPINCATGSIAGTTINATFDGAPTCVTTNTSPGVWYLFTVTQPMDVTMTLCNTTPTWDTKLSVYSGDCLTLNCVTGNDDYSCPSSGLLSGVNFVASPGVDYFVLVHGYGSNVGDFVLDINCMPALPPPPNDDCANAQPVAGPYPQIVTGTTIGATVDCPGVLNWDAVWYAIDLPYAQNYVVIDMCLDNALALNNTGIILTSDCSCDPASFIYSTGTWSLNGNCINNLAFVVAGPGTVYYPVMSDPKDDFTFNIDVYTFHEVSGTLSYAGPGAIPIDNSLVEVYDNTDPLLPVLLGTVPTDDFGDYLFYAIPGDYALYGSTLKPRGGTNILDAINTRQFLGGTYPMVALQQASANVNNNAGVDILDAIFIQQSLSGPLPAGWTAPAWHFEKPVFTLSGDVVVDFK